MFTFVNLFYGVEEVLLITAIVFDTFYSLHADVAVMIFMYPLGVNVFTDLTKTT